MYTHNDRVININKAWASDDGYQHPANWSQLWSAKDKIKWSVTWTEDPVVVSFDKRFYSNAETPRSLDDVNDVDLDGEEVIDPQTGKQRVTIGLKNKKSEANVLLHKTDWYVVRKQEKDIAIPSAIATERDAIRTACAGIETKITNASDLDAFMALFTPAKKGDKAAIECY